MHKCGKLDIELQHQHNNQGILVDYSRKMFREFLSKLGNLFLVLREWLSNLLLGLNYLLDPIQNFQLLTIHYHLKKIVIKNIIIQHFDKLRQLISKIR